MRLTTKKKLSALLGALLRKLARAEQAPSVHWMRGMAQQLGLLATAARQDAAADAVYGERFRAMAGAIDALPHDAPDAVRSETKRLIDELVQATADEIASEAPELVFAFLPYKAAMWDSLESIWRAADADPQCRAIVMPVPYAERNADGTARAWHNEADQLPDDVPAYACDADALAQLHPDAIFVHNPYDEYNTATSVDMAFYSSRLKDMTDALVYVPYYVTSGGMGEFQRSLPPYENFDVIVVQSASIVPYFDPALQDRLLPLGSPKLDRIVRICNNPPEPPEEWRSRLAGRTVYFFNTSIGGLMGDTDHFYRKMKYVFDCFRNRTDACLLWRPHPLFFSTIRTQRPEYAERFEALRDAFVAEGLGILDTTPDIETTIALCDVYVGDSGTSVTSLFMAAGKPLFLLNNRIERAPQPGDLQAFLPSGLYGNEAEGWLVLADNTLWHRDAQNVYHFACNLSPYHSNWYFTHVVACGGRLYAIPSSALEVLVIEEGRVVHSIPLRASENTYGGNFTDALVDADPANQRYLFLRPVRYPWLVRIDTETDEVTYIDGVQERTVYESEAHEWFVGGALYEGGRLYLASPKTHDVLVLDDCTLACEHIRLAQDDSWGANTIARDPMTGDLWLLPTIGYRIVRWSPKANDVRVYDAEVDGISCFHPWYEVACGELPFSQAVFLEDRVLLVPLWADRFLSIRRADGKVETWQAPDAFFEAPADGYRPRTAMGRFVRVDGTRGLYYNCNARRLWRIDFQTNACEEVPLSIDAEDLRRHAPGFADLSEWVRYGCEETALQSLPMLLDGTLPGAPFDAAAERTAYSTVAANIGTCGDIVYEQIKNALIEKGSH